MKLIITVLFLFFCSILKADWTQTNGVYGGSIKKVFPVNGNIFIGTMYGGVYVSSDNGISFNLRNSGLTDIKINSFTSEGNNVYVMCEDSGIFRTSNNGLNWVSANNGLQGMKLLCVGSNGSNIFAGTQSNGIFKSTNSGLNWFNVNNGLSQLKIRDISVSNSTILLICGNNTNSYIDRIVYSTNNGSNWQSSFTLSSSEEFNSIASDGSTIFAGGTHGKLYKATNPVFNWSQIYFSTGLPEVNTIALSSLKIILGASSGLNNANLYYTTNGGYNWTSGNVNQYFSSSSYSIVNSIAIIGTDFYAGVSGDDDGLFKSTNNGQNWLSSSRNIIATEISDLQSVNNNIFCGTTSQGISFTTDNGTEWTSINNGINSRNILSFGTCDSVYFTGTYSGNYRSTNYGLNWITSNLGFTDGSRAFISENGQIMGLGYAPLKSTDYGLFWFSAGAGYTSQGVGSCFTKIGSYTYTTNEYRIFLSPNFGTFWIELPTVWSAADVTSMTGKDQHLFAGVLDSGIYKTDSLAGSWTRINNGLTNRKIRALHTNSNKVFAGTEAGLFVTTNNGSNWHPLNNGFTNLYITSIISNATYLFAGTRGSGIWKIPLSEILTDIKANTNDPVTFYLFQNYPNPFNPVTQINYELRVTNYVKLRVYDVLGKEVAVLVNEKLSPGNYEFEFNGSGLSSGIYFYKLEAGNFSETRRMILLK
ncbi:MAG: T9SS type A sorting domain-containing protein [Ignavibacteria bacterium]|nr:T9SS type A sorting domain-containing protein [Ignavibacteria bacterium]